MTSLAMTDLPSPTATDEDANMLAAWTRHRSEHAFRRLVERHGPVVQAVCRRAFAGDEARADDAAQATFIVLARKAGSIRDGRFLAGWLHRTALMAVAQIRREEQRRHRREQAVKQQAATDTGHADTQADRDHLEALRPRLDEAIGNLRPAQREAILRHFWHGKPHRELANELGCSEAAVKMRISCALPRFGSSLVTATSRTTSSHSSE